MKVLESLFGLVVLVLGLAPILAENDMLPSVLSFIPISGTSYFLTIGVVGLLLLLYGLFKKKF